MCVSVSSVSSPLTVSVSPTSASPGRPMVTVTLPSASISAAEMYSSPSPMLTVGAAGAVVSMVSSPSAVPVLPASSVATTSTVWALSSSASGQVSDQVPSPLLVASWVAPSMVTSTVASGSSMVPLSSGVVSLVTRSLTVTTGAVVSTVALAVPGSLSLPAASVTVAVTSSVSPSAGAVTWVTTSPAVMCASVNSVSSPLTVSVSPASALVPDRPMVTVTLPSSPISSAEMYSSPSPMATIGASGAMVSISNSTASEGAELLSASSAITATAL